MRFDCEQVGAIVGKIENTRSHLSLAHIFLLQKSHSNLILFIINPLPDMPILGSSNSTAKKDMMSKIWTNVDTFI